jgi:hypothetical protein
VVSTGGPNCGRTDDCVVVSRLHCHSCLHFLERSKLRHSQLQPYTGFNDDATTATATATAATTELTAVHRRR